MILFCCSSIYSLYLQQALSKTMGFNVMKIIPAGTTGGGKKAFTAA
jgi:hypothetical protein